ncbi:MAG: amino acid permease-associated region, partial [Firmicutes bacterium]|nr:amino acid permease-associated region [Bacillota bacterium]
LMVQIKFRETLTKEQIAKLHYPMPHSPYSSWICIGFFVFVAIIMFFKEDTRIALYIAPIWFLGVIASYYMNGLHKQNTST